MLWVLSGICVAALLSIIIWGLQRVPEVASSPSLMDDEGSKKDQGQRAMDRPLDLLPEAAPFQYLSVSLREDRRFLCQLWGNDTPDLVIAFWADPAVPDRPRVSSFRQLFLPFHLGATEALEELEGEFFRGATEQGIPERSHFVVAYSFVRLNGRQQDLVIESRFTGDEFKHRSFIADSDGKLNRLRVSDQALVEDFLGEDWNAYRRLMAEVGEDSDRGPLVESLLEEGRGRCWEPHAHAWAASLGEQLGWERATIARHTALAEEWLPGSLTLRMERARRRGRTVTRMLAQELSRTVALHSDKEAQAGFLLAQSLWRMQQPTLSRHVCEILLADFPRHTGATLLLRLIDQFERGAQT
jgi:hypothetical protein